jgi:citrate synthase
MIGCAPTIAAACYRRFLNLELVAPNPDLGYVENFLHMILGSENPFASHPVVINAIEKLFILHAEHELNCSTAAIRHMTSSLADVYTSLGGAITALYGPRHGGANEAVLKMLIEIGTVENIP